MSEMNAHKKEEENHEKKKNTVTNEAYFNFSVRPAKLVE
jgi:hypothetical protein